MTHYQRKLFSSDKEKKGLSNLYLWMRIFGVFIFAVLLPVGVEYLTRKNIADMRWITEAFHSFVEVAGGCTAITLALLLMSVDFKGKAWHHIWISYGLISMGILDIIHAWVRPGNTFVWLHSLAVFFGGFFFMLIWIPIKKQLSQIHFIFIKALSILVILIGVISIFLPEIVPLMMLNAQFTWSAIFLNITGGICFLIASIYFIIRYLETQQFENLLFINLCLLFGVAGLLFQKSELWDLSWWFWHLLRLIAYIFVVGFIFHLIKNTSDETKSLQFEMDQIFRNAIDGKLVIDPDFNVMRVNETMCQFLEVKPKELIGKKCYEMMNIALCKTEKCPVAAIKKGIKRIDDELSICSKSRKRYIMEFRSVPVHDAKGNLTAIVESFIDISRQKESEKKINQQNIIKTGQTQLYEKMRSDLTPEELGKAAIQFLTPYVSAQWGAFYIYDSVQNALLLIAGYALPNDTEKNDYHLLGESLVGQAVQNKEMLIIDDIPEESIRVYSSLGSAKPRYIIAMPLVIQKKVIGAFEIASLKAFAETDIEFLKVSANSIATSFRTAIDQERINQYLNKNKKA